MSIMSFEEFADRAIKEIRDRLPEQYKEADVETHSVKRPGREYTGITVELKEQNGAPIINLNDFYKLYLLYPDWDCSIQSMADLIIRFRVVPDTGWIANYEGVKNSLFLKLSSVGKLCSAGGKAALPEDVVHRDFADLALTPHILSVQEDGAWYSIPLTRKMREEYGISEDNLFGDAFSSAEALFPAQFDTMEHILAEMGVPFSDRPGRRKRIRTPGTEALLVTNRKMVYGASALFYPGIMKQAAVLMDGSYYILPSSIHELILLPEACTADYRELERMVRHVNRSQVLPEDRLSDHVYHYDPALDLFERADAFAQRKAACGR